MFVLLAFRKSEEVLCFHGRGRWDFVYLDMPIQRTMGGTNVVAGGSGGGERSIPISIGIYTTSIGLSKQRYVSSFSAHHHVVRTQSWH